MLLTRKEWDLLDEDNIQENAFEDLFSDIKNKYFDGPIDKITVNVLVATFGLIGATTIFWWLVGLLKKLYKSTKSSILNKNIKNKLNSIDPKLVDALEEIEGLSSAEKERMDASLRIIRNDPMVLFLFKKIEEETNEEEKAKLIIKLENRVMSNLTQDQKVVYRKLTDKKEYNYKRNRNNLKTIYK